MSEIRCEVLWKDRSYEPCDITYLSGNLCEFETAAGVYCYIRSSKKTLERGSWNEEEHAYTWKPADREVTQVTCIIE